MKFFYPIISVSLLLLSAGGATEARRLGNRNDENDRGNNGNVGPPKFLLDEELPPGLVNNPSLTVGMKFKTGIKPKVQKMPNKGSNKKKPIMGLDGKEIHLDLDTAERINIFNPEKFQLSEDGTYVTDLDKNKIIPLNTFYFNDEDHDTDVTLALEDDMTSLMYVRVGPKNPRGTEQEDDEKEVNDLKLHGKKFQNFQHLSGTDLLIGYYDDDLEMPNLPGTSDVATNVEKPIPEDFPVVPRERPNGKEGGIRRRQKENLDNELKLTPSGEKPLKSQNTTQSISKGGRRAQATTSKTLWGRTCYQWDYLDIALVTDEQFRDTYPYDYWRARAIFTEAASIYWKASCVHLWIYSYDSTVDDPTWTWHGHNMDTILSWVPDSGCGTDYGTLQVFRQVCIDNKDSLYRDAMHLFTGNLFTNDGHWGCAWGDYNGERACHSKNIGYGVESMTSTADLRLQAVIFAHELGHNLNLLHYVPTQPYLQDKFVMQGSANPAPWGFGSGNAYKIGYNVVWGPDSDKCGWYDNFGD